MSSKFSLFIYADVTVYNMLCELWESLFHTEVSNKVTQGKLEGSDFSSLWSRRQLQLEKKMVSRTNFFFYYYVLSLKLRGELIFHYTSS